MRTTRPYARTEVVGRWLRMGIAGVAATMAVAPIVAGPAQAGPALGTATGRVVNSVTGAPVANAGVTFTLLGSTESWTTRTGKDGRFKVENIPAEEHVVTIKGPRGYESGYVACPVQRLAQVGAFPRFIWVKPVVPTWGESCSMGAQALGRIDLDPGGSIRSRR